MGGTTTTTPSDAARALEQCGITSHVAQRLAQQQTPDLVGAWARYAQANPSMGPGAVVNAVRSGRRPPRPRRDYSQYDRSTQR